MRKENLVAGRRVTVKKFRIKTGTPEYRYTIGDFAEAGDSGTVLNVYADKDGCYVRFDNGRKYVCHRKELKFASKREAV